MVYYPSLIFALLLQSGTLIEASVSASTEDFRHRGTVSRLAQHSQYFASLSLEIGGEPECNRLGRHRTPRLTTSLVLDSAGPGPQILGHR